MHLLIVLRHAKSAWPDVPDHDRPLADRGLRHAPRTGKWLRETGVLPDRVVCSTARRACQTWQLVESALGTSPPVAYDDRLYGADQDDVLTVIRETPDWSSHLLIVGHDPGMRDVILHLAGEADDETLAQVRAKFPTGAAAVLRVPGDWAAVGPGCATLTGLFTPRTRDTS